MRMRMRKPSLSRRNFVAGLGASAALVPFLSSLRASRAGAAAPKRAMFVYVPDGCIPAKWHPTGSETSFTLPEMSAPLEPIKQHLVFVDGLTMYSGGATHEGGAAKVLTGVGAQSLDIFLGEKIGAASPFRSLQLGVGEKPQVAAASDRAAFTPTAPTNGATSSAAEFDIAAGADDAELSAVLAEVENLSDEEATRLLAEELRRQG